MLGPRRLSSHLYLFLLLKLCIPFAAGYPSYASDSYDYNDYNDEEYEDEVDDVEQENLEKMGKLAKMNTNGETFKVDAGTTIRMPCHIENLPVSYQASVIWSKLDQKNTLISVGDKIVPEEYTDRATVTLTETGPELTLALARSSDAGRYKCSLKVGEVTQTLVQTVHIRGGREEVSSTATMLEVNQGDEMTLSCLTSSEGKETPTVAWSKQGALLPSGEEKEEGAVLRVTDVQLEDSGVYICTASDRQHPAVQRTVKVTVVLPTSPDANSGTKTMLSSVLLSVLYLALLQ